MSFVRRHHQTILNQDNEPFLLKGVGIGGWLLLEGYMVNSFGEIDRPRRFSKLIDELVSKEYRSLFFQKWYQTFFTKDDIAFIKQSGFNSIRIPLDYAFLFQPSETKATLKKRIHHFALLDEIIDECKQQGIYVILDMHAAPGGQTGTNIDNSKQDKPELFLHPLYQDQLVYIWKELANRYKEEEMIAMYDLLNEPLPKWFSQYNDALLPLYKRIIQAIREVDTNHMITLEGLHWSTDLSCFNKLLDDNLTLQFHKYWSNPDKESITEYLDLQQELDVPLFMGEGGENNLEWYYAVCTMYEQCNISYNMWTYKKMDTHNSPISFQTPNNWEQLLKRNVSKQEATHILDTLLNNIQFKNTIKNTDCVNHITRKNSLVIPAFAYDYYKKDQSFHPIKKHRSSFRKSDYMKLVTKNDKVVTPNFKQYGGEAYKEAERIILFLQQGEWVCYTFYMDKDHELSNIDIVTTNQDNVYYQVDTVTLQDDRKQVTVTLQPKKDVSITQIMVNRK